MDGRGQRCGARDTQSQPGELADAIVVDEPVVHRRYAEEQRRPMGIDGVDDLVGIETVEQHRGCADEQRAVKTHAQAVQSSKPVRNDVI